MAIIAKVIHVGKNAVHNALHGIPHQQDKKTEDLTVKKMAEAVKVIAKPKRPVESAIPTEDSYSINIIIKRKSEFLDDLTKE